MSDIAKQLEVDADEIVEVLRRKWIERQSLLLLSVHEPLFVHIEAFAEPAYADVLNNYPLMREAPPRIFWEMLFVAIFESGTHPPAELTAARAELAAKYARQ
jgi:hypothetical protein